MEEVDDVMGVEEFIEEACKLLKKTDTLEEIYIKGENTNIRINKDSVEE